jgi:hypothetical protein
MKFNGRVLVLNNPLPCEASVVVVPRRGVEAVTRTAAGTRGSRRRRGAVSGIRHKLAADRMALGVIVRFGAPSARASEVSRLCGCTLVSLRESVSRCLVTTTRQLSDT